MNLGQGVMESFLEEVALELGCKSLVRWKGRRVAFQVGKQND